MLTKDLLKYTVRGTRVHPKYLKPSDPESLALARAVIDAFTASLGYKQSELDERLKAHAKSSSAVFQGMAKLLEDRSTFGGTEDEIEELRWKLFAASKAVRLQPMLSEAAFQEQLAQVENLPFAALSGRLYGDLPEFRILESFDTLTPEQLVHRYNAAQIQGLILRSPQLRILVKDKDPIKRRRLLQKLRFWRLLAEVEEGSNELIISLSGPMSIFEKSQNYGSRLSHFFPYVLLMDHWTLEAEVKIREDILQLEVDSKKSIQSHYGEFKGYIPTEYKDFIRIFNELGEKDRKAWRAEEGSEALNIGQQNYVVPDISFFAPDGRKMHLELFHKWHQSELRRRLDLEAARHGDSLLLGVSQELLGEETLENAYKNSLSQGARLFKFRRFPTPKAILAYLSEV